MQAQRHQAEQRLQDRVSANGLCFPSQSLVRKQGDCGPDSISLHLFKQYQGLDRERWLEQRETNSRLLREVVCDYMRDHPDQMLPHHDLPLCQLLPEAQQDWPAYCDKFRATRVKVETPFLAAAALHHRLRIVVISSTAGQLYDTPICFEPDAPSPIPPLFLANLENIHFEPLMRARPDENKAAMEDIPEQDSSTTHNKRQRTRRQQRSGQYDRPDDTDTPSAEPTPTAHNHPLQPRQGTKRRTGQQHAAAMGLTVGVTATEREALTFYQPWFNLIHQRPSRAPAQGEPPTNLLLEKAIDHRTRMFKRIPPQARKALIGAVRPALQAMVGGIHSKNDALFLRALQSFFIIPQCALVQRQDKPLKAKDIRIGIERFQGLPRQAAARPGPNKPQPQLTEHELALRKAIRPASHGAMQKATQRLEALHSGLGGPCEPTEDILEQLRRLHPSPADGDDNHLPTPDHTAPLGLPVSRAGLRRAGKKIANGSAADVFGWTGELMAPLLQDKECAACLTEIARYIRDGCALGEARDWLLASWLVALDKGGSSSTGHKVRPIAGGTILFKLVATYLIREAAGSARNLFEAAGVQYGVLTPDGVTAAARIAQLTLDASPNHTILKTDFKNAFNLLSRRLMLQEVLSYKQLAPFHRMVHWTYSAESSLYVRGKDGIAGVIRSRQGVRQGCVFGSLAYAVATLRIFKSLKDEAGCEVVAVLDDLSLVGEPREVFAAFEKLREKANHNHLPLQVDKCEALWPLAGTEHFRQLLDRVDIRVVEGGMPLLGTIVGNDHSLMQQWAQERVDSWKAPLRDLKSPVVPAQVALLLARTYSTSKPNFLSRSLPPQHTVKALAAHDREVLATVSQKLNLDFTNNNAAEAMLRLPLSRGGVGLTPSAAAATHGFIASMAATLPYLAKTGLRNTDLSSLSTVQALGATLASVEEDCRPDECPAALKDFLNKFSVVTRDSEGLQSKLAKRHAGGVALCAIKGGPEMEALYTARADHTLSSAPFRAYPLTAEFTLTNDEVRFAVAFATNVKIPETPSVCSCKVNTALDASHAVSCGPKMVLARHNRLQRRFAAFAEEQGITVASNVRVSVEDSSRQQEPDLVLYFGAATPLEVDITV